MDIKDKKVGSEGKSFAKEHGMHYFEVSAKKGEKIEEMVESII